MKPSLRRSRIDLLALTGIALAACGGSPPPEEPPSPSPPSPSSRPPTSAPERPPIVDGAAARNETARRRAILEERVYFDFDQSTIRADAKRTLDAKLPILREDGSIRLRLEGHADERGSTEYNLALGSRRATAIRDYLTGYGLAGDRFEIVSYGEARPLAHGSNEAAWGQNRRGEFVIRAGLTDR